MYVAVEQIHQSLTLYRGEFPEQRRDILMNGLGGRVGNVDQIRLVRLPIDLLAHLGHPEIAEHVLHGSHGSPFTSWTESPQMAAWYALDGGRRARPHSRGHAPSAATVVVGPRRRDVVGRVPGCAQPAADPDRRIRCADSARCLLARGDRGDSRIG